MRSIQSGALALCVLLSLQAFGEEPQNQVAGAIVLTRTDALPQEIETSSDSYFEGYLQALIDMHFAEYRIVVLVKNRHVWLANLPKNSLTAHSIAAFVRDVPGVCDVTILDGIPCEDEELREKYVNRPTINGIWFPQTTELFQPLIAAPRQAGYSIGYRSGDEVCGNKCVAMSLGDDFPIYRWLDLFWNGDLQISIDAGIWSVFNMDPHPDIAGGTELVNTDFYVGVPLTYASGKWSFRFRGYHISGHLGDEFLINHPGFHRVNPSIEGIDFYTSYQITDAVRLYVGPGVYVHSDPSYKWKPMYIEYGTEVRFLAHKFYCQRLYGTCFIALDWRNLEQLDWNFDGTYIAGYEFSKLQGIGRKLRFYIGFHHGYSLEGQFAKLRTHYMEYNFSYGY